MTKIGIICEGKTEYTLFSSENFKEFLASKNIALANVINAKGSGNLLPQNIHQYIKSLEVDGAEKIVIVTDLDENACITLTKQRIGARQNDIVVIAVRQIEAWFLACTSTMRKFLNDEQFLFEFPETEKNPFETIRTLRFLKTGQGLTNGAGGKTKLISMLVRLGLDITQAALHPNCPSAAYFIGKLNTLT